MTPIKKEFQLPFAPETHKTYYYEELKTAYDIAVSNAIIQNKLANDKDDTVCDVIWGNGAYDTGTLKKMKLGFNPPNYDFLCFIRKFAGEKYNYMFLASEYGHSTISKVTINEDGFLRLSSGKAFDATDITNEMMCAMFLMFVERKYSGEIAKDVLFYDYLQSEPQERQRRDPLFYNYLPDLKRLTLQNLEMVNVLPELVWYLVLNIQNDDTLGSAVWNLVDQIIPSLSTLSNQSKDAQFFIRMRDGIERKADEIEEVELSEYQIEFILNIPALTTEDWNIIIKLVTLCEYDLDLYREVINLISQILQVFKSGIAFSKKHCI